MLENKWVVTMLAYWRKWKLKPCSETKKEQVYSSQAIPEAHRYRKQSSTCKERAWGGAEKTGGKPSKKMF